MRAYETAIERLSDLLVGTGWRVERPAGGACFDLLASRRPGLRYAIRLKAAADSRRPVLEDMMASAMLVARAGAGSSGASTRPLAVVFAPSISVALLDALRDFASRFGEGTAWGVLDGTGLARFSPPELADLERDGCRPARDPARAVRRPDVFSDLGQWMLKVLLCHRLPPDMRSRSPVDGATIDRPASSAAHLSSLAGVSTATAARLVAALNAEGFLGGRRPISLIRIDDLLAMWRSARGRRPPEIRARWLLAPRDTGARLADLLRRHEQSPGRRACLGLFAACDRMGFRFVSGVSPHLLVEDPSTSLLDGLRLGPAEPGESADVFVRTPGFPETAFRGALVRDGIPVSDPIECWLDVSDHPARGQEMSDHLLSGILGKDADREPDRG